MRAENKIVEADYWPTPEGATAWRSGNSHTRAHRGTLRVRMTWKTNPWRQIQRAGLPNEGSSRMNRRIVEWAFGFLLFRRRDSLAPWNSEGECQCTSSCRMVHWDHGSRWAERVMLGFRRAPVSGTYMRMRTVCLATMLLQAVRLKRWQGPHNCESCYGESPAVPSNSTLTDNCHIYDYFRLSESFAKCWKGQLWSPTIAREASWWRGNVGAHEWHSATTLWQGMCMRSVPRVAVDNNTRVVKMRLRTKTSIVSLERGRARIPKTSPFQKLQLLPVTPREVGRLEHIHIYQAVMPLEVHLLSMFRQWLTELPAKMD